MAGCGESAGEVSYDSFAYCLNQAGVHLYVSATCPHCHDQLAMFGESAEKLNKIDCYYEGDKCATAEVRSVPTWIFADGERKLGVQTFETLSQKTNCQITQ